MKFICGEDRKQTLLIPERVEDYVADTNPVRVIDAFVNGLNMAEQGFSRAEVNATGRPPMPLVSCQKQTTERKCDILEV